MKQKLPTRELLALGFFMFALFLGAGNIIFPPILGQQAGESLWPAVFGFLATGVGLPLLAIIAVSAGGNLDNLARRVSPGFQYIFPFIIYLAIGPFFGIPRTGTVAYEIGVLPFLPEDSGGGLFIFTPIFFAITFWLALNPAKLVDRIGKLITPILFALIVIIAIKGFSSPMDPIGQPLGKYIQNASFSGFNEGYLTMDAIAALVFGLVIINRIQEKGLTKVADIRSYTIKAGVIAGIGLSFVYITLAYMGATSVDTVGLQDNGGAVLAAVASHLFGQYGSIILAVVIIGACLTTSIGLVSACGEFLSQRIKGVSYRAMITIICLFSLTMANLGLSQLIAVSLPVLTAIYPVAIVLILLSLVHAIKVVPRKVYVGGIIGAAIVSIYDGFISAGFEIEVVSEWASYLPFMSNGVGWIVPSLIGMLIGFVANVLQPNS